MAKEGGKAAGRPAGAGLCRVTRHDKIISSAGHWGCSCCCRTIDTSFPSLLTCNISAVCVLFHFCNLAFTNISNPCPWHQCKSFIYYAMDCNIVWLYAAGRGRALTLGYCSCCGLWLVLHLHGLCNLSLKDYCWFLAGRGNLCTRD